MKFVKVHHYKEYTDYEARDGDSLVRVTFVQGGHPYLTIRDNEGPGEDLIDAFETGLTESEAKAIIDGHLDYTKKIEEKKQA